jgi:GAF domain-containing protein
VRPILERRRFSSADKDGELMRIAKLAHGLPLPSLQKAVDLVLNCGFPTIKPQRVVDAISSVRAAGAMIVHRCGTPQFTSWVEYFRRTKGQQAAAAIERMGVCQVPTEWPPALAEQQSKQWGGHGD